MSQRSSKTALLVVFLTVFIDLLGFGMVLPLIPVYAKELTGGYSEAQTAWVLGLLMTCYSIMQLIFAPVWGRVSDRVGRRPILILSLAGSTVFYFLFGVATWKGSILGMFLSRIGGGIVGATIPTAQAYIADVTPPDKRTKGMALIGVAFGLGFTFGPLVGALALVTAAQASLSPWPGYTASILSLAAFSLAVVRLPESLPSTRAARGRRRLDLSAVRDALVVPSIAMLLGTLFLCNFGFSAFEATLSLVLAEFLGVEKGGYQILLAFAYVGLVQTIVQGGLVRWMAGFTTEGALSVIGVVAAMAGYLWMAFEADPETGRAVGLMLGASVVVSGLGFIYPSVQSLISRRSDPAKQGGIMGLGGGLNSLARITGIILAMHLHERLGQTVPFWVTLGLMGVVLVLVGVAVRAGRDWPPVVAGLPTEPHVGPQVSPSDGRPSVGPSAGSGDPRRTRPVSPH
jgi:MFS family permease